MTFSGSLNRDTRRSLAPRDRQSVVSSSEQKTSRNTRGTSWKVVASRCRLNAVIWWNAEEVVIPRLLEDELLNIPRLDARMSQRRSLSSRRMNCCRWKSSRNGACRKSSHMGQAKAVQLCAHVDSRRRIVGRINSGVREWLGTLEMQGVSELLMLEGVCWNVLEVCEPQFDEVDVHFLSGVRPWVKKPAERIEIQVPHLLQNLSCAKVRQPGRQLESLPLYHREREDSRERSALNRDRLCLNREKGTRWVTRLSGLEFDDLASCFCVRIWTGKVGNRVNGE
ncbi:hypothetical protein DFH06DRAFT_1137105 [Mycena polygramma]|nr:hypothetical protein DFH06DRAFT_1137105 [Mycena polygramma]